MHPTTIVRTLVVTGLLCAVSLPFEVLAQKGRNGPELSWNKEITILPNTIQFKDSTFQAFSFTVFETDAKTLLEMWRNDYSSKSVEIEKGEPMVANGAMIERLSNGPITVLARTAGDKKAGTATMTIAFKPSTNGTIAALDVQEAQVREMAVRYNRAVVEEQIKREEKVLEKSKGQLSKSVSKDDKLNKNILKTNASLNKVQASRMKEQTKNARLQGQLVGAEHAYTISKDVKDLKKLTKARDKLSAGETKVAKLMEKEARIQSTATKYSGNIPDSNRDKEGHSTEVAAHETTLEALRTKLNNIR